MKKVSLLAALFLFGALQLVAQEKQVTFDTAGRIRSVDALMAQKIGQFTEYPDFREAFLYQTNDSTFTLEIVTGSKNDIYRTRKMLNLAETEALRASIEEMLLQKSPKSLLNQEGRTQLLLMNSLISYSFYGSAVSSIISSDFSPAVYLLSAGAGFITPLLITRNKEVTLPQAGLTIYGQSRGIIHGMLLPVLFGSDDLDFRLVLGFGMAGSIAEGLLGYKWAKKSGYDVGQVSTLGLFSDWGMVIGLGATHALGLYSGDHSFTGNLFAMSVLGGAAGGMIIGNSFAKKGYYSQGDAGVSSNLAVAGAYLPVALLSIAEPDDPRWYTAVGTLGAAAGLYAGDRLARKYEFSNRQAMFTSLSMIGGGLLGAGVGNIIAQAQDNDEYWYDYDPTWMTVLSAVGAVAGVSVALLSYTKDSNKENKNLSFRLQMNPLGFMNSRLTANDPTGRNAIPILVGKLNINH